MNRVSVKCKNRRPERIFDMLYTDNGDLFIEMKFQGKSMPERIKINRYLQELGIELLISCDKSNLGNN